MALTTFVFFQLFNLQRNWRLWAASVSVLVLQVLAMTWDWAQRVFTGRDEAVELDPADWAQAAGASVLHRAQAR